MKKGKNTLKHVTNFEYLISFIARINTTFYEGVDYTFRRNFDMILNNKEEKKSEINHLKLRKNEIQIQHHIFDLEKTISLNQEMINKIIPTLNLNDKNKKTLLNHVQKIYKYFNNKQEYRYKIKNINSKILMNKQIIEEIKRRKDEIVFMHKDQVTNMENSVNKKGNAVKLSQRKFKEVEIFIQRESKKEENLEKYGKWKNFTLIPFMKKNEELLKRKFFYETYIKKTKDNIEKIKKDKEIYIKEKIEDKKIEITFGNRIKLIDKYYKNNLKLAENEKLFIDSIVKFLFENNSKKLLVPSFKSKNPISNLDVKLNLLPPGIVELELNLKKMENEENKTDEKEKETINKINIDINKINDNFEKELAKEGDEKNDLKGKEIKPPENDDWLND
jgi:hypothetical protein